MADLNQVLQRRPPSDPPLGAQLTQGAAIGASIRGAIVTHPACASVEKAPVFSAVATLGHVAVASTLQRVPKAVHARAAHGGESEGLRPDLPRDA